MYKTLLTSLDQGIFLITINRADKMNALNRDVMHDLDEVINEVEKNAEIRAVILTGSGQKAFVAGADISEFLGLSSSEGVNLARTGQNIFFKFENCSKPIVAAVNGFALGGGCELAMACHFRIASTNAKFGQPEVNLGLIPGYGGTQRLTMLVGKGKAMELMMTGNMVGAEEALKLGLVNYVQSPENLLNKTKEILSVILTKSPLAISKVIEAVNAYFNKDGFKKETQLFGEVFSSDDKKEGTAAFLEKRKPVFK